MAHKKGAKVDPAAEVHKEPEIVTGTSEFSLSDGSTYNGDWKEVNGAKVRDGQGIYTLGPEKYVGQWAADKMSGVGEYTFASGSIFKGQFKDNMMNGEGEYVFSDGAVYSGDWFMNKMHGNGKYVDKDKVEYSGKFVNGMFDSGKSYISVRNSNK